jgi:hypothetical protein
LWFRALSCCKKRLLPLHARIHWTKISLRLGAEPLFWFVSWWKMGVALLSAGTWSPVLLTRGLAEATPALGSGLAYSSASAASTGAASLCCGWASGQQQALRTKVVPHASSVRQFEAVSARQRSRRRGRRAGAGGLGDARCIVLRALDVVELNWSSSLGTAHFLQDL